MITIEIPESRPYITLNIEDVEQIIEDHYGIIFRLRDLWEDNTVLVYDHEEQLDDLADEEDTPADRINRWVKNLKQNPNYQMQDEYVTTSLILYVLIEENIIPTSNYIVDMSW